MRIYGPRLQQLGFTPRQGEPATDALLRGTLISTLGKMGDPAVVAEAKRLFAAWQGNPDAILAEADLAGDRAQRRPGDVGSAPREGKGVHRRGRADLAYQLLGATADKALAQRAGTGVDGRAR